MVTLNDIARACGVSKTTVSRVLNNDSQFSVSAETRELIHSTAASMNYDTKKRLRSRKKASKTVSSSAQNPLKIGILSEDYPLSLDKAGNYYAKIFSSLISTLSSHPSALQLQFQYTYKSSYDDLQGLDGLIIIGKLTLDPYHPVIASIKYKVFVDYVSPDGLFDSVRIDFDDAVNLAISYFQKIGLYDIGFIGSYDHITTITSNEQKRTLDSRQIAFENYCYRNHINPKDRVWITETFTSDDGYHLTNQVIRSGNLPQALLYASDELALGGYKALQEHKLEIGKDISVIGIDNLSFTNFLNPPLTTVSLNISLIGSTVADALLSQIEGRSFPLTIHPPIHLIIRSSCKMPDTF